MFSSGLTYKNSSLDGTARSCEYDLLDPKVLARHTIHQFPAGQAWTPQTLEIKGRVGKVVCVLAEDKIHYRQYSIEGLDEEADDSEELDLAMSNE